MYNIGICDDGENICTFIEETILRYAKENRIEVETEVWYTGKGLCNYLTQGNHLDILFLDIELWEMTGIDVGNFIRNNLEDRGMQIIYISGKSSYAQQLFKTQPLDFLVKPIEQAQIIDVLELAVKLLGTKAEKFEFQVGKAYYYIPYEKIMYFCSSGRKIRICMPDGEEEFYGRLRDVMSRLPGEFVVIHKSYVVNKQYIVRYTYDMVELTNGTILTISKANRKQVREYILQEG